MQKNLAEPVVGPANKKQQNATCQGEEQADAPAPQVEVEQEAEGLPLQALKTGDEEKAVDAEEVARVAPPDEENDKKRKQEGNSAASAEEQVLDFLARGKLRLLKKTARLPKRKKNSKSESRTKGLQRKGTEKSPRESECQNKGQATGQSEDMIDVF